MQNTGHKQILSRLILSTILLLGISACGGTKVTRMKTDTVTDLSGKWNDTDSRLVSSEMIDDVLSHPWLTQFNRKYGRQPVIIIGTVRNLSHEHISTRTFINDLEMQLINSGEVDFVASAAERQEVRMERRDQDLNASEESRKAMGNESGADFMLKGSINTIIDAIEGKQIRFYQIDMNLINLQNNRKVWVGQKKIKKTIENSRFRP